MKSKRYTEEQIVGILKEWQGGIPAKELARKHGVTDASLYAWRKKYSGMEVGDVKRLKFLEEENRKLKRLVADQQLDILALKDINSKKW